MPSSATCMILLAGLCLTATLGHEVRDSSTCTAANGACDSPESHPLRDHALLQMQGFKSSAAKVVRAGLSTSCTSVSRRRRQQTMTSCRRRHSSAGHLDTDLPWAQWKCNEAGNHMYCDADAAKDLVGYPSTGQKKAAGLWCEVDIPPPEWSVRSCPSTGPLSIKVLTYNLYWWNLFKKHGGGDRSAGSLIARTSGPEEYDFMAFQECDDRHRVLNDAVHSGLSGSYHTLDGGRAIAMAYLATKWTLLAHASIDVGEDSHDQYYGKRSVMWARFQNAASKTVFFMNHHGPLMVSQGGGCTGSAAALNIMRVIGENAHKEDVIILVGDFNAKPQSSRIQEMDKRLFRVFSGHAMGGVDHIFSNCPTASTTSILGKGDGWFKSDHDALSATFRF